MKIAYTESTALALLYFKVKFLSSNGAMAIAPYGSKIDIFFNFLHYLMVYSGTSPLYNTIRGKRKEAIIDFLQEI